MIMIFAFLNYVSNRSSLLSIDVDKPLCCGIFRFTIISAKKVFKVSLREKCPNTELSLVGKFLYLD